MKTCPYCSRDNREGVLFCEDCGHPFVGKGDTLATTQLVAEDRANIYGRMTWGTARFDRASSVLIRIRDQSESLRLDKSEVIMVGRSDPKSDLIPDLDLASYGAAEQGVSRRHAMIKVGEDTLTLTDLDSTNGTYLNGQRLLPNQPRVIRDGDEIRLGRLTFHVFFK